MLVSAEIRWFWPNDPPIGLEEWFLSTKNHPYVAGGGAEGRCDRYLRDKRQKELGIKIRGTKPGVEIKGLVAIVSDSLAAQPFIGDIEIWSKWTSESIELQPNSTIAVEKQRWLRKFSTSASLAPHEIQLTADETPLNEALPERGCNVELTRIKLPNDDIWWTFGFEAFGGLLTAAEDLQVVANILVGRHALCLSKGILASYPAWLSHLST